MIPLWMFTLGSLIYEEGDIVIPFQNIIGSLVGALTPVVIGLFLQRKLPRVARRFVKMAKYVMAAFIVFVLTVGIYANVYVFYLVDWKVLLSAALLPYSGFFFGCFCAFALRQDRANVIAIAVETGIQNTGLPIVILQISLTGPEKATSLVPPVMSALFTPLPLVAAVVGVQARAWLRRRRDEDASAKGGGGGEGGGGKEEEEEEEGGGGGEGGGEEEGVFQIKYEEDSSSKSHLLEDALSAGDRGGRVVVVRRTGADADRLNDDDVGGGVGDGSGGLELQRKTLTGVGDEDIS